MSQWCRVVEYIGMDAAMRSWEIQLFYNWQEDHWHLHTVTAWRDGEPPDVVEIVLAGTRWWDIQIDRIVDDWRDLLPAGVNVITAHAVREGTGQAKKYPVGDTSRTRTLQRRTSLH